MCKKCGFVLLKMSKNAFFVRQKWYFFRNFNSLRAAGAAVDDYLEVGEAVSKMEAEEAAVVVAAADVRLTEYGVERFVVGTSVFPS